MAYAWIDELFAAQAANGGVVRRARKNVNNAMLAELIREATSKHFHVIETGDQVVVLCHEGELILHC